VRRVLDVRAGHDTHRAAGLCGPRGDDFLEGACEPHRDVRWDVRRDVRVARTTRGRGHIERRPVGLGKGEGPIEALVRAVGGQRVGGLERLEPQRWRIGFPVCARVAREVLTAQHPFLRDDGEECRVDVRSQLSERVALCGHLGEWPEAEAHDPGLEHGGGERCRSVEGRAVRREARRPPQLPTGLLGRGEAGVAQLEHTVPVAGDREAIHPPHEPVDVAEREQLPQLRQVAQGRAVSTRSTTNTRVSPGPITPPAPRSP
jgi:hypothetical protein